MLFNSPEFLFGFLPLVLGVYYALGRLGADRPVYFLVAASLFFYGWWKPAYLLLIGASIVCNYAIGRLILTGADHWRKPLLILGVTGNLAAIGYFKYAQFITQNIDALFATNYTVENIVLPLAISFFTFQQIAFLVDAYQGKVQNIALSRYGLFVLFFPQLIAGPIVHHRQMMPQFAHGVARGEAGHNINRGVTLFSIGLFKKIVLADTLAIIADPAFAMAAAQQAMTPLDAWAGALAYTFQLYFDFSGYSDMALGLAIMFGIRLPLNFYSPYKARSIIDFWRRWHITLSSFLRDYVYIPLGGNRRGRPRRYLNLLLTMLLGGLWHGAGWSFVIWGGLHGLYLAINHGWRALLAQLNMPLLTTANRFLAPLLTFLCVVLAWVYFRAPDLASAHHMLQAMFGTAEGAQHLSRALLGQITEFPLLVVLQPVLQDAKSAAICATVALAALIAFALPNPLDLMGDAHPALAEPGLQRSRSLLRLQWRPSWPWALFTASLLLTCVSFATRPSPFLYFQF